MYTIQAALHNNFAFFSSTPVVTAHEAKGPSASTRLKLWQKCGPPVSLGNLRIEAEAGNRNVLWPTVDIKVLAASIGLNVSRVVCTRYQSALPH